MVVGNLVAFVFLILLVLTITSIIKGAPFVATDKKTLFRITKLVRNVKGKNFVDLGSGDGRVVIGFAKRGANAFGYEINPFLVLWSKFKISQLGLSENAKIFWGSYWDVDLKEFDIVNVFGISYIMKPLEEKLVRELKKESRVISLSYKFPNLKIVKKTKGIYLYKI